MLIDYLFLRISNSNLQNANLLADMKLQLADSLPLFADKQLQFAKCNLLADLRPLLADSLPLFADKQLQLANNSIIHSDSLSKFPAAPV
ncbi:hypothetical protein COD92_27885 [Bacillus sp. AFS037270]|nr:hypothetical protein COD92_27885 [Bacillus sp. AFS037270]